MGRGGLLLALFLVLSTLGAVAILIPGASESQPSSPSKSAAEPATTPSPTPQSAEVPPVERERPATRPLPEPPTEYSEDAKHRARASLEAAVGPRMDRITEAWHPPFLVFTESAGASPETEARDEDAANVLGLLRAQVAALHALVGPVLDDEGRGRDVYPVLLLRRTDTIEEACGRMVGAQTWTIVQESTEHFGVAFMDVQHNVIVSWAPAKREPPRPVMGWTELPSDPIDWNSAALAYASTTAGAIVARYLEAATANRYAKKRSRWVSDVLAGHLSYVTARRDSQDVWRFRVIDAVAGAPSDDIRSSTALWGWHSGNAPEKVVALAQLSGDGPRVWNPADAQVLSTLPAMEYSLDAWLISPLSDYARHHARMRIPKPEMWKVAANYASFPSDYAIGAAFLEFCRTGPNQGYWPELLAYMRWEWNDAREFRPGTRDVATLHEYRDRLRAAFGGQSADVIGEQFWRWLEETHTPR